MAKIKQKKPKIRLIVVGEGLKEIVAEISAHCAHWGHEMFRDSGEGAPHHEAIIVVLRREEGTIVINASIDELKIQGNPKEIGIFTEAVVSALTEKLINSHINKN